jgi:hypothetical protein
MASSITPAAAGVVNVEDPDLIAADEAIKSCVEKEKAIANDKIQRGAEAAETDAIRRNIDAALAHAVGLRKLRERSALDRGRVRKFILNTTSNITYCLRPKTAVYQSVWDEYCYRWFMEWSDLIPDDQCSSRYGHINTCLQKDTGGNADDDECRLAD